jgi:hypothetical protein
MPLVVGREFVKFLKIDLVSPIDELEQEVYSIRNYKL